MKFIHRLGYYLGGFSIGIVILMFILSGKKTSCDYGPNSRTLKNIRIKERNYSAEVLDRMATYQIDSTQIAGILQRGKVHFDRTPPGLDSCKTYYVSGAAKDRPVELVIENCDSQATIMELNLISE